VGRPDFSQLREGCTLSKPPWKYNEPYLKCSNCGCLRPPGKLKVLAAGITEVVCKDEKACEATLKGIRTVKVRAPR
jgi:hypothetical protein